jgi:benzil reductase ((S)-benzoin forming)
MRVAIITGGSKGLGASLCAQLVARGDRVIEFSRSAPHAFSLKTDLASPDASRETMVAALSTINAAEVSELIVINNAGMLEPIGPASRKPHAEVIANLNTNLTSAIVFISAVVGHFRALPCRKVIANISSGAALHGYAGWALYCAAKAGMENFIRALAVEQRRETQPFTPINVNPGVIDTDMQALIRATKAADFPDVDRFVERKARGELTPPDQVAKAVLSIIATSTLEAGARYDVADYVSR